MPFEYGGGENDDMALEILTETQRELRELQERNYDHLQLTELAQDCILRVQDSAEKIYGKNWNYYSNALRREVAYVFERSVIELGKSFGAVDYLEIGSAQGLSMAVIGLMLKERGLLNRLVSLDPYYESGYKEGARSVWEKLLTIDINKKTKENAQGLYSQLGLKVEQIEAKSLIGLKRLIRQDELFHLVYIDGSHEFINPAIDFGLSCAVTRENGIIMLDDHFWPDVRVIKELCDRHCVKVEESWKVAAYKMAVS